MGTRKSKHNRGRKPLYKEHRQDLIEESAGLADRMSVNTQASASNRTKDGCPFPLPGNGIIAPIEPPDPPSRLRFWRNTPAEGLSPSKQPNICEDCGGTCSPKSSVCFACFKKKAAPKPNLGYRSPCQGKITPDPRPAADLLALLPENYDCFYMHNFQRWKPHEEGMLATLIAANADVEKAAMLLGRPTTKIVNRARERGLYVPPEWAQVLPYWKPPKTNRRKGVHKSRILVDRVPLLQFPYLRKERPENVDLLRINTLVPRAFSEDMRADIVQSIMLALYEGTVAMDEIERNRDKLTFFVKKFRKEQQPYQEISGIGNSDDDRSYEDIVAAAKMEWRENENSELRSTYAAMLRSAPATQIEHVYAKQIKAHHKSANEAGRFLSLVDAMKELS